MGNVRLYGATSGYTELAPPAVANDNTLTLPANGFGKILQVVSTAKTDIWTSSATSFTAVTGLSASITPIATSSKILIMAQLSVGGTVLSPSGFWKVTRGGTDIYRGDAAGSRIQTVFGGYFNGNLQDALFSHSIVYLDSPSSTSSLNYRVEAATSAGTIKLNAPANDADNGSYLRGASSITVMEISA